MDVLCTWRSHPRQRTRRRGLRALWGHRVEGPVRGWRANVSGDGEYGADVDYGVRFIHVFLGTGFMDNDRNDSALSNNLHQVYLDSFSGSDPQIRMALLSPQTVKGVVSKWSVTLNSALLLLSFSFSKGTAQAEAAFSERPRYLPSGMHQEYHISMCIKC